MDLKSLLRRFELSGLQVNAKFLNANFTFNDSDRDAAWEMYIELLTRVTTQNLYDAQGDEKTALESVYSLFPITREILRKYNRKCVDFSKIAIIVLNQIIRPFTAKWHKLSTEGAFQNDQKCSEFRDELRELQKELRNYTHLLAELSEVEDLTDLEFRDA